MVEDAVPQPPWLQPARGEARKQRLSRDTIVDAALKVVDAEGLDGLSMRRVGAELETGAASLYWHVRNREELLHLMLDRVAAEIELPEADPSNWQEQVKELAREMLKRMLAHRDLAKATLGRIPLGPHTMRVAEWLHGLLRAAGLPDKTVALSVDLFSLYVGAIATEESGEFPSPTGEDVDMESVVEMYRSYVKSLPPAAFPHTLAIADLMFDFDQNDRFEFGLDVLVAGLARTAEKPKDASEPRPK
jgi:AcrR family transcriptional regulator